ncbi:MAG TPA: hypothetical protein VK395_13440 [Gemmataceae bacterium]|nr:hypothetical protein [Gemmataceae bacterium]
MNLLRINFQELYERHLCRHSQFGINVIHLAAFAVTYLALFSLVAILVDKQPLLLLAIPVPYFVALAFNIPVRVLVASLVFVALFFWFFFSVPLLPFWVYLVAIVLAHQVQNWSHKWYSVEKDMTEFNKKYKKGPLLFVLLLLYELPILLNYLVFGRKNWAT